MLDFNRSLVSERNEELRTETHRRHLEKQLRTSPERLSANRGSFEFGFMVRKQCSHIGSEGLLTVGRILRASNRRTLWR